jgi:hypothetical protein
VTANRPLISNGRYHMRYERLPAALLREPDDHYLFQHCYEHITRLLGEKHFPPSNIALLEGVTEAVKVVWELWWFQASVALDGMSAWVLNCAPQANQIIYSHKALREVGATELLALLEASIPIAARLGAEFVHEPEVAWFGAFQGSPTYSDMEDVDRRSLLIASEPLSSLVAQYIRAHQVDF